SDDATLSPPFMAGFQSLAHDLDVADTFETVIHTPTRHLDQRVDDIVHFARINKVSHAKLSGERFARGVEVDADNARGPHHLCALDYVQANSPQSEIRHR